ncbi:MAG: hypothetical protein IT452_13770 [Planctomycetia bacterium]|nr:hypothetical protein [Planctomycetia bacterium]
MLPEQLFQVLERDTPFCLCLGLHVCEAACLELFTTPALVSALREADRLLTPAAVERLKTQVLRRALLAPCDVPPLGEEFERLLVPVRHLPRGSRLWSEAAQRELARIRETEGNRGTLLDRALGGLLLPPKEVELGQPIRTVLPLVFSVQALVESAIPSPARSAMRRGLCVPVEVESRVDEEGRELDLEFEGASPSMDLLSAAKDALRELKRQRFAPTGRLILRLPPVMELIPVEGASLGLAFHAAFDAVLQGRLWDPAVAVSGKLFLDRVEEVGGVSEKRAAARDAGCNLLVYVARREEEPERNECPGARAVAIPPGPVVQVVRAVAKVIDPSSSVLSGVAQATILTGILAALWPLRHVANRLLTTDGMQDWTAQWAPQGWLQDAASLAIGLPLTAMFAIEPLLVIALAWWIIAPRAMNTLARLQILKGRISMGAEEAPVDFRPDLTCGRRIFRRAFRFFHGWVALAAGAIGVVGCRHGYQEVVRRGVDSWPGPARLLVALVFIAAAIGAVVAVAKFASWTRRRIAARWTWMG